MLIKKVLGKHSLMRLRRGRVIIPTVPIISLMPPLLSSFEWKELMEATPQHNNNSGSAAATLHLGDVLRGEEGRALAPKFVWPGSQTGIDYCP